ncbi:MAG: glutathione-independent formaldehyde dehydrogenase [Nocardiopsaceae bacterium]|nr:glutathione-independent formaldehyde dehydrogenase [Nocardiopsaceae bacterium]
MKAVVYKDAYSVAVEDVPEPVITDPRDVIIKITTTNICGSDLHMYEGRTNVEPGKVLGHENMGVVVDTGPAVENFRPGDRVSVPFNVACGTCRNCVSGWTSFCLRTNPTEGVDGGAYGYASMGPWDGGQAEYLKVPYADFNLLALPPGTEHENDFTMLSDIFPTAYFGADLAQVSPGDKVAVYGAGPVGLLAVHSAWLRGAAQVFAVDMHADRLRLAEEFGGTPVDIGAGDPAGQIMDATNGAGADCGIEAVGYQAHDPSGQERPELVMDWLIESVRPTGRLGVVGVYLPADPGAATEEAKDGRIAFDYGRLFQKGQALGTGQCPVKRYNEHLREEIIAGRATPSKIVSHELPLSEAPSGYEKFDKRIDGYTKVLLHPAA